MTNPTTAFPLPQKPYSVAAVRQLRRGVRARLDRLTRRQFKRDFTTAERAEMETLVKMQWPLNRVISLTASGRRPLSQETVSEIVALLKRITSGLCVTDSKLRDLDHAVEATMSLHAAAQHERVAS
ncbi:MAG: hypothetical protein ACLQME_10990 [Alphaproteobacteria bacterium]